ncbi:hypothetical protein B0T25DRAFT_542434 [Lasiosphaeria hispida]|uniref:Uncharacterized protein n=1 Tax=Lasiosphaeria hispida TaxID=260671 RepID=A0AAJ0HH72_9PEZI|nr:hypothetical protein B0T25DRAFT_542434 [Lasiosphaeria hispida]
MDWLGLWRAGLLNLCHTPKEPEKDPFLVALVIALVQHERWYAVQPLPSDSSFTVCILVAGAWRPRLFHLYVAHVQARFLDKLDFLSQEPVVDLGLDIDH